MKTSIYFYIRLLTVLCLLAGTSISAQNAAAQQYTAPHEFQLFEEPVGHDGIGYLIPGRLYPIGWSADGMFAYIKLDREEASESYYVNMTILDARNNRNAYYRQYYVPETGDSLHPPYSIGRVWEQWHPIFEHALDSFHIAEAGGWKPLESNPYFDGHYYLPYEYAGSFQHIERELEFSAHGNAYKIGMTDIVAKPDSLLSTSYDFYTAYSFRIDKNGQPVNKISHTAAKDSDMNILDTGLLHAFGDPTGHWAVFIYRKLQRGWEGPPHVNDFGIEGFEL